MDIEVIYYNVNKIFDEYINEGINPEHFLNYLNSDKNNFDNMYNRIYKKLTLNNVQFDSDTLKECMTDIIRNNIYLLNDLTAQRTEQVVD